jgi:hypothetical protein
MEFVSLSRHRRLRRSAYGNGSHGNGSYGNEFSSQSQREKVYGAFRGQLEHEDELIGMRNGWLVGGESFLFAAYAVLLTLPTEGSVSAPTRASSSNSNFASAGQQLFHELPVVGIVLALLAFLSVFAALWRERQLRKKFSERHCVPRGYPEVISRWPRLIGHGVAMLVPAVMVGAWIVVLVARS